MTVKYKWHIFLAVTGVCFFLDWITKHLAMSALHSGPPVRIVGHYLQLMLVYNKAALFGLDPRHILPFFPLNTFFFIFSIIAITVIIVYFKSIVETNPLIQWGLTIILPGALGNLFDRALHPQLGVVDFIRVGISDRVYWPIFNIADAYVTIGVALILLNLLREERQRKIISRANGKAETSSENTSNDKC
jgi:signal peptidase II